MKEYGNVRGGKIKVAGILLNSSHLTSFIRSLFSFSRLPFSFSSSFSLIEVIIVLAILAVLASLAIPQYRKFVYKAKISEVKTILPAIAHLEDTRESEKGKYITCGWYPGRAGKVKQEWRNDENSCFSRELGFNVKGGTFCDYAVVQGDFSRNPQSASPSDGVEVESTPDINITIIARCDIDGDGRYSFFTITDESSDVTGPIGDDF